MVDALYQRKILDLAQAAVAGGQLDESDARVELDNPLCGDRVSIEIRKNDDRIDALAHMVRGCVLCQATASIIGTYAVGSTKAEVSAIHASLKAMLSGNGELPEGRWQDLQAMLPVREFKSRHTCVLLPFDALEQAMNNAGF
jgi:SUF system NifU family Fe-S assembly protein